MDRTVDLQNQEKLFQDIMSFLENKFCSDCRAPNPDWVSTTFGVFICYKCSGIHRSFGMHIARVKSTKLDTWTLKQLYIMGFVTNKESNIYWEANLPEDLSKPNFDSTHSEMLEFLTRKYIDKAFADVEAGCPAESLRKTFELEFNIQGIEEQDEFYNKKLQELKDRVQEHAPSKASRSRSIFAAKFKARNPNKTQTLIIQDIPSRFSNAQGKIDESMADDSLTSPFGIPLGMKKGSLFTTNLSRIPSQHTIPATPDLPLFQGKGSCFCLTQTIWRGLLGIIFPFSPLSMFNINFDFFEVGEFLLNFYLGLRIKTQSNLDEVPKSSTDLRNSFPRKFFKFNTQNADSATQLYETRVSFEPSLPGSRTNLSSANPSKLRHANTQFYEETGIFNETKDQSPKGSFTNLEMEDISFGANSQDLSDPFTSYKVQTNYSRLNINEIASCSSIMTDESPQVKPFSEVPDEPHLKRPSESFEMPKFIIAPEIASSSRVRGWSRFMRYIMLMGCVILHLIMGYAYSWGSISPYIASLVLKDYPHDKFFDFAGLNMLIFLGIALGYGMYEKFTSWLGLRQSILTCLVVMSATMYLCSLTRDVLLYSCLLTIIPGVCIGLLYEIPFFCATQCYSLQHAFLRNLFYISNGVGAFLFNVLSYCYLNRGVESTNGTIYASEMVERVPMLIQDMSYIVLGLGLVGVLSINPRASYIIRDISGIRDNEESLLVMRRSSPSFIAMKRKAPALKQQSMKEVLMSQSSKFLMLLMILFSVSATYLLCSYKSLGLSSNLTDAQMSVYGGLAMIVLHIGKSVGVTIYSMHEFKALCKQVITYQAIAMVALFFLSRFSNFAFIVFFMAVMFFDGLMVSLVIEETRFAHLEDIEDRMVALVLLGYALSSFLSFLVAKPLLMMELKAITFLVLAISLYYANKMAKKYSRATVKNEDYEMVSMLLKVESE